MSLRVPVIEDVSNPNELRDCLYGAVDQPGTSAPKSHTDWKGVKHYPDVRQVQ